MSIESQSSANTAPQGNVLTRFLKATEIDTRLLGMIGALVLIWVGFHLYGALVNGNGAFLTPRNLWNLTVQTASIGIMACGMVLVIVTRHIDLSVGSVLGFCGMIMGVTQVWILPNLLGLGHPLIWVITVIVVLVLGTVIGAFHGWLVAYRGIPAFIVTLGGLLIWRGAAYLLAGGETISPVDSTFALLGGGPLGAVGAMGSWVVCAIAVAAILWMNLSSRKARKGHGFPLRPLWAEVTMIALTCGLVIGATLVVNAYPWPKGIVAQYATANNITVPDTGLFISHGWAIPVLILMAVGIVMTVLATRTRFGRYVFAIGGNPDAAELSGINTRWLTVKVFALMGILCGISAVIAQARLQNHTNDLGTLDELRVIAAAVIGGTALSGGVGTIYGAILGALIMQSLQSGMAMVGADSPFQNIVVGMVLVVAVWIDIQYRKRKGIR